MWRGGREGQEPYSIVFFFGGGGGGDWAGGGDGDGGGGGGGGRDGGGDGVVEELWRDRSWAEVETAAKTGTSALSFIPSH